jgi:hypothetical protein
MKKLIVLFGIMAVCAAAFGQEDDEIKNDRSDEIQTIVGKHNVVGGYGALSLQYTEIQDRDAFVFGARGAIVLGHMMSLGLAGSGFFNDAYIDELTQQNVSLTGGYGGFFFEPVIFPKYPVHVAFPILIGAGGVSVVERNDDNFWEDDYESKASDAFLVLEPGIELELNVTRFFRFCLGGYYRYTSDVDIPEYDIPTDILKGFSAGVTFKFGRF